MGWKLEPLESAEVIEDIVVQLLKVPERPKASRTLKIQMAVATTEL